MNYPYRRNAELTQWALYIYHYSEPSLPGAVPVPDPLVAGQVFLVAGLPGESLIALPAAPGGRRALHKYKQCCGP